MEANRKKSVGHRAAVVLGMLTGLFMANLAQAERVVERTSALYLLGHYGGKMVDSADANTYFGTGAFSSQIYQQFGAHVGFQFGDMLALEGSIDVGPYRNFRSLYSGPGSVTGTVTTDWNLLTYSVTPALSWAGATAHGSYVNLIGIRLGLAALRNNITDSRPGAPGNISQDLQAFDYGVIVRSEIIASDHFSIGLEGGYDWTRFNNATNPSGNGNSNLDFSGPHASVVVGLWSNAPVKVVGDVEHQ